MVTSNPFNFILTALSTIDDNVIRNRLTAVCVFAITLFTGAGYAESSKITEQLDKNTQQLVKVVEILDSQKQMLSANIETDRRQSQAIEELQGGHKEQETQLKEYEEKLKELEKELQKDDKEGKKRV